jgi:AcrR family transcriptional regulator
MNDLVKPKIVARWEPRLKGVAAQATEAKLIEGARHVLRDVGLRGATSRAIAAAADVNLGAITYHFGSKDELVARALLQEIRGWMEPSLEILRRDMDPAERLMAAVDMLRQTFDAASELLPVYLEALVAAPRHDTLKRGVKQLLAEVRGFLGAQLAELQEVGYVPGWVDPEAMATLLVSTADGIALHAALEPDAVDPGALAAQAVQLLLAARAPQPLDPSAGAPPP